MAPVLTSLPAFSWHPLLRDSCPHSAPRCSSSRSAHHNLFAALLRLPSLNPSGLSPSLICSFSLRLFRWRGASKKTGITDTPLPPYQPSLGQHLLKSLEQLPGTIPAILFQRLLDIPDRSRIRYSFSGMQTQKYHETKSIPYLKLALLIAQAVKLLQYQRLEHQHRINGRTPSLAPISLGIAQNRLEFLTKQLPVSHLA